MTLSTTRHAGLLLSLTSWALTLPLLAGAVGCGVTPSAALIPAGAQQPTADPAPSNGSGVSAAAANATPGALEQVMLERINRARLHPAAEAAANGIAIDEGIPGQLDSNPRAAVAFNGTLARAAIGHADDMLANDFFAHKNLLGQGPADRIDAAGYAANATGENLAWDGTTGTPDQVKTVERMHTELFVDSSIRDRGHRIVMLHTAFQEIGIAIRLGPFKQNGTTFNAVMAVQDYGAAAGSSSFFMLGVVYDDRNGNSQYDFGEGSASSQVTVDAQSFNTGPGGGYAIAVSPGNHTITFASGASQIVGVKSKNVKVDLVNGTRVDVNLGLGEF